MPTAQVDSTLHVATAVHPRLPWLRVCVLASPLHLHFSPSRYSRLLGVLSTLAGGGSDGSSGASDGSSGAHACTQVPPGKVDAPLWVTDAEYVAKVGVLAWEGLVGTDARWHARWARLWRGSLYLTAGEEGAEAPTVW